MLKTQPELRVLNRLEESSKQSGKDRGIKKGLWESPGGPEARAQCFHCQGPRLNSWWKN